MSAFSPFLGEIYMFAGNFAPRGWAFCNGQLLSISQNSALFAVLGTTYGGNGVTVFALPNLQSRVPMHAGQGPGLSNRVQGEAAGAETATIGLTQLPAHSHAVTLNASTGPANTANPDAAVMAASEAGLYATGVAPGVVMGGTSVSLGNSAGGNTPHPNVQPYQAINFIIALEGIFPSRN
jgi:microcystin-dependent protein